MIPLGLVYYFEYLINQGLYELLYFPTSGLSHSQQYRYRVTFERLLVERFFGQVVSADVSSRGSHLKVISFIFDNWENLCPVHLPRHQPFVLHCSGDLMVPSQLFRSVPCLLSHSLGRAPWRCCLCEHLQQYIQRKLRQRKRILTWNLVTSRLDSYWLCWSHFPPFTQLDLPSTNMI